MSLPVVTINTLPTHGESEVEIVERKGQGHPDTLCDDLSELACRVLCQYYRDTFGVVLPHKMDQFLLIGSGSRPALGGGELIGPIRLIVRGTAVSAVNGRPVATAEILEPPLRALLRRRLRLPDPDGDLAFEYRLRDVLFDFDRFGGDGHRRASEDTSVGVGCWPPTRLERLVLELETELAGAAFHDRCAPLGSEVKLLAVRSGRDLSLTIAAAMLADRCPDRESYEAARTAVAELASRRCGEAGLDPEVVVNSFDDIPLDLRARSHTGTYRDVHPEAYVLVTGSHAEKGTGLTGRGNRLNRLITPMRPMSMEAAWGKPPWHPGKLYAAAAHRIARRLHAEMGAATASVYLTSRIGADIASPASALACVEGTADARAARCLVEEEIARLPDLAGELEKGGGVDPPEAGWLRR